MSSDGAPGNLFVVSAPSGAGKTSLVASALARDPALAVAVSQTTRPRRPGEVEGRDYCFVTTGEFLRRAGAGEFLERADVFGHHYGTLRAPVAQRLAAGLDLILEIDWQGAAQVRAQMPCTGVFVLPPSRAALEARLLGRGQDEPAVIARRLAAAIEEMAHHTEYDYLIVNDDFDTAVGELLAIVQATRLRTAVQRSRHAGLVRALLSG
jgi:guanylate kinase